MRLYRKKSMAFTTKGRFYLLLIFLSFLVTAKGAGEAVLYQGEVPVASYSPVDWQKAVTPALQQVLVRVSANPNVVHSEVIRKALEKPALLVQSYNYVGGGAGQPPLSLQVRFSPKAINALLEQALPPKLNTGQPLAALPASESSTAAASSALPSLTSINLQVAGISGLQDYIALSDYLRHLPGVTTVDSKQTRGDKVWLTLKTNSTVAALVQQIAASTQLVPESANTSLNAADTLNYKWVASPPAVAATPPPMAAGTSPPPEAVAVVPSPPPPAPAIQVPPVPAAPPVTLQPPPHSFSKDQAPVVEGVPSVIGTNSPANSEGQAQSFAAPVTDNAFVPENGSSP